MSRLADHLNRAWLHRGFLACALWPLSALMSVLVRVRRMGYRHRWLSSVRLPVPVLVVGNRIVGGAGKTPTTIAILQHLQARGMQPGVLTRGYKAQPDACGHRVLDDRTEHTLSTHETGDEPMLVWRHTRAPMAIGRDRAEGGRALLRAHPHLDILVCDDGLQHLKLQRDIEVIVFDERGEGNGWLLPAGPLREAIDSPDTPGLVAPPLVLYNAPRASTALPGHTAQRHMAPLVNLAQWWQNPHEAPAVSSTPAPTAGATVHALAGIAQPQRFFQALQELGYIVQGIPLDDHADFSTLPWDATVTDLIVTEKDAIKLDPSRLQRERPLTRIWVAGLDFRPEAAFWAQLDAILDRTSLRHTRARPAAAPLT
ncbi:MAG: tetraacyldisaccharide 4'-kinase [Aquabacterium sp.]|jgi:tetraacyldisaccharide 4'-kinase|uniref:tetraacyldisaccharide 4'-kinase n=1 Tax=Aquabacterium sp. TaxID=1872578 RepID=UPI001B761649|nr:tetraacyldisaccharide 4'-kinase [Aquabacterium sp.]MBP7131271.1 tetraacyldisaccharide 4'-kinase [Aquabacterium sp.]MBP9062413.1 tetraacyldisaccharide 4'-kinase [Aquabacterium sp.]MDQ5926698.1 tetraacyldisaccharide 4-kinase [Pseudomonadota bacterium]